MKRYSRRLGLLIGSFLFTTQMLIAAGNPVLVDATFDPPGDPGAMWQANATDVHQGFGEGLNGSSAYELSAVLDVGGYAGAVAYQDGLLCKGGRATPANTELSFYIKVDRPGLQSVSIVLEGWQDFIWAWLNPDTQFSASSATVPVGPYTPGTFKKIVLPLNSPLWKPNNPATPSFDPNARTFQFLVTVGAGDLPDLGHFTITIDNIQLKTKTPTVPWNSEAAGVVTMVDMDTASITETGWADHLDLFTSESTLSFNSDRGYWAGTFKAVAGNGDELRGLAWFLGSVRVIEITGGTGRFNGAVGSVLENFTWIADLSFETTATGAISSVGSNK